MSPISMGLLAMSMSADAFVASVGRGAVIGRPSLGLSLRTGLVFGIIETITPLIGWALGHAASDIVEAWDHWIAFALLGAVGLHMIWQGLRGDDAADAPGPGLRTTRLALVATAIGTSIDAMAVGVTLAFLEVNILLAALMIGGATTIMSTLGMLTGRVLGRRFGRLVEVLGGLCLVGLGAAILYQHLHEV